VCISIRLPALFPSRRLVAAALALMVGLVLSPAFGTQAPAYRLSPVQRIDIGAESLAWLDGSLYASGWYPNERILFRIDPKTGAVQSRWTFAHPILGLAGNPDTGEIYISQYIGWGLDITITRFNPATSRIVGAVPFTTDSATGLAFADGRLLIAHNDVTYPYNDLSVLVVDPATGHLERRLDLSPHHDYPNVSGIEVTEDTLYVGVDNGGSDPRILQFDLRRPDWPYVGEFPLGEGFRPSNSTTHPAAAAFDGTNLWIGWAFGIYRAQLVRANDGNRLVALRDVNGNGASELAVLYRVMATYSYRFRVTDSQDRSTLIDFPATHRDQHLALRSVPDYRGSRAEELAILDDARRVSLYDGLIGDALGDVVFDFDDNLSSSSRSQIIDFRIIADEDGDLDSRLALLTEVPLGGQGQRIPRVDIRSMNGDEIGTITYSRTYRPRQLVPLTDYVGDPAAEIAIVTDGKAGDIDDRLVVSEGTSGNFIRSSSLNVIKGISLDAASLGDLNGDRVDEVATLVRAIDHEVIVVNDPTRWRPVYRHEFHDLYRAFAFTVLDDINGNESPELAVAASRSDGKQRIEVVDSVSGQRLMRTWIDPAWRHEDMSPIADLDGNGAQDLAVLVRHRVSGALGVFVKEGATGIQLSANPIRPAE